MPVIPINRASTPPPPPPSSPFDIPPPRTDVRCLCPSISHSIRHTPMYVYQQWGVAPKPVEQLYMGNRQAAELMYVGGVDF
jgi:hypothetical protein